MDGIGWDWMMTSKLGKQSQFGLFELSFAPGLAGLGFQQKKKSVIVYIVHL